MASEETDSRKISAKDKAMEVIDSPLIRTEHPNYSKGYDRSKWGSPSGIDGGKDKRHLIPFSKR